MNDASALHRYRSKGQKAEDLASVEMLRAHLRVIALQEQKLNNLIESADVMVNTDFATKSFENFARKKDVDVVRSNYENLLNHEARKERDVKLATEYTDALRERNKESAERLQKRKNERQYWRELVEALRETDTARQETHVKLEATRRDLKVQIDAMRDELEKRQRVKAMVKSAIAELQLQLLEHKARIETKGRDRLGSTFLRNKQERQRAPEGSPPNALR